MATRDIALVAHDNKKSELLEWASFNKGTLSAHHLYATGTTGTMLEYELGLPVKRFLSGPVGGDQQIGARIAEGTIDMPISAEYRDGRRDVTAAEAGALPARTHYRVRERFGRDAALVELTLDTGRQHQIRVHLSSIGHPVLGDRVYGAGRESAKKGDRPLLHAWKLAFPHPLTGRRIAVEAELPRDFRAHLQRLRAAVGAGLPSADDR